MECGAEGIAPWRVDLEGIARSALEVTALWRGLGTYIMTRNRFRLFQLVEVGETDYGLAYLDYAGQLLCNACFPSAKAALVFHLLMLFVISIAVERQNRQAPGAHKDFIVDYASQFDRPSVPEASYLVGSFAKLHSST